jgi:hypothetical protein
VTEPEMMVILIATLQEISRDMPEEAIDSEVWGDDMEEAFSNGSDWASYIDAVRARKALKAIGVKPEGDDPVPMSRCDDCHSHWRESELDEAKDLDERLDHPIGHPDCIEPSGECPECGALCYEVEDRDATVE